MTCSRNFRRIVQASCLGLIGALTVVGCGGSETKPNTDGGGAQGEVNPPGKPNINATPATVALGSVDVGTTSTPQTVTITNTGSAGTVTVTPTGVGISASGCGGTLAAGGNCIVSITATPTAVGPIVGSVAVVAAGGNAVSISVTGQAQLPGNFTVSPTAIALGDVAAGTPITTSVTVSSTVALTGLSVGVTGPDLKLDPSSTCGAALTANTPCKVTVVFNAAAAGTAIGDAIVVSQGGVTKTVPVSANVLSPAKLGATPATASLTAQPGSSSANLDINVGNTGGMVTGQIVVALAGTNAADFAIVSDKCSIVTLAAGAYCTVTVKYTAAATATVGGTATLTITDKGAGASSATVALTGIVNASTLSITPATGALGSVAPGASGAEVVFTVSNSATGTPTGALAVAVSSAIVTVSSNTCATKATLAAGDSCTVGLKLTPSATTAAQAISGLLTVTGATAGKVSASFTGAVVSNANLVATPTSVSFGSVPVNQQSAAEAVTIKNVGATATGTLAVTLAGAGAAQVAITANTCTGSLAPAATCTFSVRYSPTDTTGVNGTVTIGDGSASISVPMVGTGIAPSPITVTPNKLDFGNVVIGYSAETTNTTLTTVNSRVLVVQLVSSATTASGAISTAFSGTNASDFTISTANSNCSSIQPGQSCTLSVVFTPSATGSRTADLTVSGANGGLYVVALKGNALPLVQLIPLNADATASPAVSGLDFGMQPNGTGSAALSYRVVIRGATDPAAASTLSNVALVTGTPADFQNVNAASCNLVNGSTICTVVSNPCNGATLTGLPATATSRSASANTWAYNRTTTSAGSAVTDDLATGGYWTCDFAVQFVPQTGKSATAKTATINASGSAGGTASLSLTGISSGPLTINPTSHAFQNTVELGTNLTLSLGSDSVVFTVRNAGVSGVSQGPLVVAPLSGANAGDFGVIGDTCSGVTLASGTACYVTVGFAPTAIGSRTATLTVSAGTESVSATLTGSANQPASFTISPTATSPNAVDLGSVALSNIGAWTTFTITNPANGALTGKLVYGLSGGSASQFEIFSLATAGATSYPAGACGDSLSKQLTPGGSCTLQVRFKPVNTSAASSTPRTTTLVVYDPDNSSASLLQVPLKGTATSQLALSGTSITLDTAGAQTLAFGSVANGATSSATFTITNNGGAALTLGTAAALPTGFSYGTTGTCVAGTSLAAGQSCQMNLVFTATSSTGTVTQNISIVGTSTAAAVPLKLTATRVSPAVLALYGIGDYPAGADSSTIELGAAPLSSSTGVLTLWFKNSGGVAATGLQSSWTAVSPAGNTDFAVVSESPGTCLSVGNLAAGATCSVNVRCIPTLNPGSRNATLNLFGVAIPAATVALHATGITTSNSVYAVPVAGGTDTLYTFGSTASYTGTAPAANTVYYILHNNTATAFPFSEITALGATGNGFGVAALNNGTGVACGTTVAAGGSTCMFQVTFNPTWTSITRLYRFAAINLNDTTLGVVNLLGVIGQVKKPAQLQLSAASTAAVTITGTTPSFTADFGQLLQGQTPSLTFTITNIGELPTAGAVGLSLSGSTYATVGTSTCGTAVLAAGASCTVAVNSQLTSTIGEQSDDIVATATDASASGETSVESYTLTARVVNPASLTATATGTAFSGTTPVGQPGGTITINVVNGGTGDDNTTRQATSALNVALSDSANFAVDSSSTCLNATTGAYYALGAATGSATALTAETCTIVIKFNPQTAGSLSTKVTVSATTGGTPPAITLTATGVSDLAISPNTNPVVFTSTQTFTVSYVGTTATKQLKSSIGGTNASAFAIVSDSCFGNALSSSTCEVTVKFVGTSSATAAQTATLTVTDGSTNNTVSAALSVGGP